MAASVTTREYANTRALDPTDSGLTTGVHPAGAAVTVGLRLAVNWAISRSPLATPAGRGTVTVVTAAVLIAWDEATTVIGLLAGGGVVGGVAGVVTVPGADSAERLPAALIQAQRDFFGAHTYHRTDKDGTFHTEWTGDRTETETGAAYARDVTVPKEAEKVDSPPQ